MIIQHIELGIIESDDIKLIQQEIEKAVEFSKKVIKIDFMKFQVFVNY